MLLIVCLSGVVRIMSSALIRRFSAASLFAILMVVPGLLAAQSTSADVSTSTKTEEAKPQASKTGSQDPNSPDYDKRNRQLTEKEKKEREKAFKNEVSRVYKKW